MRRESGISILFRVKVDGAGLGKTKTGKDLALYLNICHN
jgi:hypothetical protein